MANPSTGYCCGFEVSGEVFHFYRCLPMVEEVIRLMRPETASNASEVEAYYLEMSVSFLMQRLLSLILIDH